jgi:RNA polymerase sigma-70 factor, ECF subfamily
VSGPGANRATNGPGSPEDAALVQDCLRGSPGAWDRFVDRFAGLFHHVVDRTCSQRRLALSAADRDDVIAEILVEVLKENAAVLRGFAGRSSLATYLAVIARRTAVRMLSHTDTHVVRVDLPTAAAAVVDHRPADHRRADREEIEGLMGCLEPDEARLIRLHHLEARSYGEISRLTGLPLGSIGPALSRARQKMREVGHSSDTPPAAGLGPRAAG